MRPKDKENLYEKYVAGKEGKIEERCRDGADNNALAALLGIGVTTLKKIFTQFPEFHDRVNEAKRDADENVESALYKRAIGYDWEEKVSEVRVNEDGTGTNTVVRTIRHHTPADTAACIFWLKNRRPNKWRDKQEVMVADTNVQVNVVRD